MKEAIDRLAFSLLMKNVLRCLAVALCSLAGWLSAKPGQPNIVLIYADDLGWKDVGYQGDGFIETPVLDALQKEGMSFTNAYASSGNCQPSRACLLSGNYTPRHHVYAVHSTKRGPVDKMRLEPIPNQDGLELDDVTIAEALKAAGYATAHIGKWHLYNRKTKGGALASDQGFDFSYDSFGEGELPPGSGGNKKGPPSDPKGVFDLSGKAQDFMREHQDEPFFVYLAHHAPHTPLQARPETKAKFKEKAKQLGKSDRKAQFAAMVYDLDASIGRVLQTIDELGLKEETLVIFTSDNGGIYQWNSQEPLRGDKGCYYEGGIREPFLARLPGVIPAGATCEEPIIQVDLYPTFLDLAGGSVEKELDGESLVPLFSEKGTLQREAIFWHFPAYLDRTVNRGRDPIFRTRPVTVIRKGEWKLHLYHEEWLLDGGAEEIDSNHAVELYHLGNDIGERVDLAGTEPEKRDELIADLLAWMDSVDAQFAQPK
ncbi:MAG: sulfatase [Verrucomicrobiota bacterium JB023]|nr:sulfatase [Verrucomicrobiota bacterium JB023]